MIKRFCDWCGEQIADDDLMPVGVGAQHADPIRLGMGVRNFMPVPEDVDKDDNEDRIITVVVGPISVDGLANAHHFHKACVQAIVTSGVVQ